MNKKDTLGYDPHIVQLGGNLVQYVKCSSSVRASLYQGVLICFKDSEVLVIC